MKNLKSIMLIDDNPDDNFIHERAINKTNLGIAVISMDSGQEALKYLKLKTYPHPDLIFLDINMPGMNGWEFLSAYGQLDKELQSSAIITMLTTSQNPDDEIQAHARGLVSDYITKPLTAKIIQGIIDKYFK